MSFGWSAGDIATAITVVYNLIQALDSVDGAAGDYREAVAFLGDLNRTLEPLQTFTILNAYPAYRPTIREQVSYIKEPTEHFLAAALKFEPSLGIKARNGHHRHVLRKLQWHIFISKKMLALRRRIESHMRVIDTLMQRLTLDLVWTTQQQLPNILRTTLLETLRPELIAVLRENLPSSNPIPLERHTESQNGSQDKFTEQVFDQYQRISSDMEIIKEQLQNPRTIQRNIDPSQLLSRPESEQAGGSFQEVYYLVFLYLGCFLKHLFLALVRIIQPSAALMPTLLAEYNISFLDVIGRPPRILPYEFFSSFQVLQAFIEHEFKDILGPKWLDRSKYVFLNHANNNILSEQNWSHSIGPGATVAMSIILRKRSNMSIGPTERPCRETSCPGSLTKPNLQSWTRCLICKKEVLDPVDLDTLVEPSSQNNVSENNDLGTNFDPKRSVHMQQQQQPQKQFPTEFKPELIQEEENTSIFKRIVQPKLPIGLMPPWHPPLFEPLYDYTLPCEFRKIYDCTREFHPQNWRDWIIHCASHFVDAPPPPKAACTFCRDPRSIFSNWQDRMIHIGRHHMEHARDLLPDFYVIKHLDECKLLTEDDYERVMKYSERAHIDGLVPFGYNYRSKEREARGNRAQEMIINEKIMRRERRILRERGRK